MSIEKSLRREHSERALQKLCRFRYLATLEKAFQEMSPSERSMLLIELEALRTHLRASVSR